jgi:hypothetical protein
MLTHMKFFLALAALLCAAAGPAQTSMFAAGPTARKTADGCAISFTVAAPTDVEVAILAGSNVVRHLAAGVLGGTNAPPAPLQPGLKQEIAWDGKDDLGNAVPGFRVQATGEAPNPEPRPLPALSVRVRVGLSVEPAGPAFGCEPQADTLSNVIGLSMGPNGRVYVMSMRWQRAWWTHTAVHVFGRNGSYERTIKPFPNTLPPEKVAPITHLRDEQGRPIPTIHRILAIEYTPTQDLAQQPAVTPDGNLHMLVVRAAYHNDREEGERYIASVGPDGSVPFETFAGPKFPGAASPGDPFLAASTDGKAIYLTGINTGKPDANKNVPNGPTLYRLELATRTDPKPFFGEPGKPGNDSAHLNDPRGVAVDGKGRVFVADRGNNRVVVLKESSGAWIGSFDVPAPTWVGAHRGHGGVYVATSNSVVRFTVDAEGKAVEKGRLTLPALPVQVQSRNRWCFALDDGADPAFLWIGHNRGGADTLQRCTEKDGAFTAPANASFHPTKVYWNIAAGYDGKTVACKIGDRGVWLFDEDTEKMRYLNLEDSGGETYRLGPNNQIYGIDHWRWGVRRWTADGRPFPFPATTNHVDREGRGRLLNAPSGTTCWERDFDVDRTGKVYVKHSGKVYHGRMRVDKYDQNGNSLGTVIWVVTDGAMGPRVDGQGNVYVADIIKPVGQPIPDFFKGNLVDAKIDKRGSPLQQYTWMYGSVIKFGPAGGAIWFPILQPDFGYAFEGEAKLPAGQPKVKVDTVAADQPKWYQPGELQGALWFRYGVSYILDMQPSHNRRCHCTATEFDVDEYGRVFHTDQGRFRVVVLDGAGNEILAFGRYGNQDATGLTFNWFTGLGVSERYVYAADGANLRVVRGALRYAATTFCPLP